MNKVGALSEPSEELYIKNTYEKWRRMLLKMNVFCALMVLMAETAMFFVFKQQDLVLRPVSSYLFRFLVLPTLLNGLNLLAGFLLLNTPFKNERIRNYIPVLQLTMICFIISSFHFIFPVVFCTFCFPIFVTIIFNDREMTWWITAISIGCLTAAQFIGAYLNDAQDIYRIPGFFVAVTTLIGANIVCAVLTLFQKEKDRIIEESYRRQLDMRYQLNLDQKTGLYGSTAFHNRLHQSVKETPAVKGKLALAILDIDNFKLVNDTYGHSRGDIVINRLAELMDRSCGDQQFLARFGGEEFAIIFIEGSEQESAFDQQAEEERAFYKTVLQTAEEIRGAFSQQSYDFTNRAVTLSVGLAFFREGWTAEMFFDYADRAMYSAKAAGKNRVEVFR